MQLLQRAQGCDDVFSVGFGIKTENHLWKDLAGNRNDEKVFYQLRKAEAQKQEMNRTFTLSDCSESVVSIPMQYF